MADEGAVRTCVRDAGERTQRLPALPQATDYVQLVRHRGLRNISCIKDSSCALMAAWVRAYPRSVLLQVNVRNGLFVRSPVTGRRRLHQGTCQPAGDICKPLIWWCLWAVQL